MTNSRAKGKRGELEAALLLTQLGLCARRSAQYCGADGDADLRCNANLHVEVKLQEQMHPYKWLDQAIADASKTKRLPLVLCRRTRSPWLVIMRASNWVDISKELLDAIVRAQTQHSSDTAQGESSA